MKKIDLHIHTTCSDGVFTPKQILEKVTNFEMDVFSITDHDNIDGFLEVKDCMPENGPELIPGVEISSNHNDKDVHILAYFFDPDNAELKKMLGNIHTGRFQRAEQILERLQKININISMERIRELAGGNDLIGRPHIARAIIEAGLCRNTQDVFDKFLGEDCPGFVPKPAPSSEEVIKLIKETGGVSVLAHPYTLRSDEILYELIELGIDGMEVFYAKHNAFNTKFFNEVAITNKLIRTGGTDFHGDGIDLEFFGKFFPPEEIIEDLERARNLRRT
jgi:3',5'-nucleoside bisphosphate phosphatase